MRIVRKDPYLRREDTGADEGRTPAVQHYEKQNGSDGATSNTVFTLSKPYVTGSNTLMVFVNGQKAELLVSATDATEYEETNGTTVTFGASLLDTDVVEFMVVGTYFIQDTDNFQVTSFRDSRNIIINGDMRISQRGTSFAALSATQYVLDRWKYTDSGTTSSVVTITQESAGPSGEGFEHCLKLDVTTAESGGSADELHRILQQIEADHIGDLGYGTSSAKSLTLSFWFKSDTKTGTFCTALVSTVNGTTYITEHTVSDNNWNKYTVTIPGDTANAITMGSGIGLSLQIVLNAGSTFHNSAGSWLTAADYATSNQDNFLDNVANNLYLTGVQLEVGSVVTNFDHRSVAESLALCQRYYEKSYLIGTSPGTYSLNGAQIAEPVTTSRAMVRGGSFKVLKRTTPTMTYYDVDSGGPSSGKMSNYNSVTTVHTISSAAYTSDRRIATWIDTGATMTVGTDVVFHWIASAEL